MLKSPMSCPQRVKSYKTTFSVVGIIALSALLSACNDQKQETKAAPPQVDVLQARSASVTRYLYETGTTKAVNSVDLVARVSGALRSIDYKDGTEVKAGSRLFLIEPDQYQAQLQQAQATVDQAQASYDNAVRQLDRQMQLAQSSVTTETNIDNARATRDTSKAELESAQASLALAKLNLSYTSVTAPFDGHVTEHQADVGALVGSGGPTTLATIVQLDPIQVSFSISDTDMLQIRERMRKNNVKVKDIRTVPVEVGTQIDNDYPFKGNLDYASPETTSDSGTLAARAIFQNPNRTLLPGLFVRIRIPIEKVDDALLIPPATIGTDQQGRFVLIVNDKGVIERRSVTLLDKSGDLQQIRGPLSAQDWIVANVASAPRIGDPAMKKQVAENQTAPDTPTKD